LSNNEKFVVF